MKTVNFLVTVSAAAEPLTLTDAAGNPLDDGASVTLPGATVGAELNEILFNVSGGVSPYTFAVSSGAVPDGTSLNSTVNSDDSETVTLEGAPTTEGESDFSLEVSDSSGGAPVKVKGKKKIS